MISFFVCVFYIYAYYNSIYNTIINIQRFTITKGLTHLKLKNSYKFVTYIYINGHLKL